MVPIRPASSRRRTLRDSKLLVSAVKTHLSEHLPEHVPPLSKALQIERWRLQRGRGEQGFYCRYDRGERAW